MNTNVREWVIASAFISDYLRNEFEMQKLLHSIDEGIEITGLKRTKFLEEVYSGRLKSVTVGRRRLITRQALEDYVGSLVQQAADSATESFTWPEQPDDR